MTRAARALAVLAVGAAALAAAGPAGSANECDGLMVCVSVPGPWVVVSTAGAVPRQETQFHLSCPRGHVVGGLDAELSVRPLDVRFLGNLGSPVNPGITTERAAVFVGTFVGRSAPAATFRPFLGCVPATGGGVRVPTSAGVFRPGRPLVRRVRTVRVRPGSATVAVTCAGRERLVGAAHAVAFRTRRPPSASLVGTVSAERRIRAGRVVVRARGDAELGGVRALVQVQAICARAA
ncbi:MAG TPA: hypothetical protein VNJ53_01905 [Gaiellaceae bacterium]|nr:hypothetical protein [Gaiellaceae bacterium]